MVAWLQMAAALGETGITKRFAEAAAGFTGGWIWSAALAVLLVIYFYAHYGFASITAHVTAMYTPFLVVIIAAGAPPALAVLSLADFSNLSASLTHYRHDAGPIYFGVAVRDAAGVVEVRVSRLAGDDRDLEHGRLRVVEGWAGGAGVSGVDRSGTTSERRWDDLRTTTGRRYRSGAATSCSDKTPAGTPVESARRGRLVSPVVSVTGTGKWRAVVFRSWARAASGKTTLLRCFNRLVAPDSGMIPWTMPTSDRST